MQQQAAVLARRRCVRWAAPAGNRLAVVRLGMARRASWAVRARSGLLARAHLVAERRSKETAGEEEEEEDARATRLFVGLPADVVTDGKALKCSRAVKAGLRALKLLGVDGVELPVSWAVVQPGSDDDGHQFEWAGYLAVAGMVRDAGLGLRVSFLTHGAALPGWAADADILLADRSGNRHEGCLSFAVDELPVLAGKSPIEAYEAFFRSFADAFHGFLGSTITDVTVSLGPNGELRYPSYPPPGSDCAVEDAYLGVGEFQCYDKHMLARLKLHADSSGQPLWGLSGPHDAPGYGDASPESTGFFREQHTGAYGAFFLSWYAGELLAHGDRVLAAASRAFRGAPVEMSAKVPFFHHSGSTRLAAEATAGLYGGYGPVAEMFARHACTAIVSVAGMPDAEAGEVLARIKDACTERGARFACESASVAAADADPGVWGALLNADRTRPCHFTYQRMGAEFFSPDHWPLFVQFAHALESSSPEETHEDDLPGDGDGFRLAAPSGHAAQGTVKEPQTA